MHVRNVHPFRVNMSGEWDMTRSGRGCRPGRDLAEGALAFVRGQWGTSEEPGRGAV